MLRYPTSVQALKWDSPWDYDAPSRTVSKIANDIWQQHMDLNSQLAPNWECITLFTSLSLLDIKMTLLLQDAFTTVDALDLPTQKGRTFYTALPSRLQFQQE